MKDLNVYNMNKELQKLLERTIKAEAQAKFLYHALLRIRDLAPFDEAYEIAESAINGYNAK